MNSTDSVPRSNRRTRAEVIPACHTGWLASGSSVNYWGRIAPALRGHDSRARHADSERQGVKDKVRQALEGQRGSGPRSLDVRPQLFRLAGLLVFATFQS